MNTGAPLPFPGGRHRGHLLLRACWRLITTMISRRISCWPARVGYVFPSGETGRVYRCHIVDKLPADVANGAYTGAWAVDVEADGDLDVVLGSKSGEPRVLRNNGDGAFSVIHAFPGVSGIRQSVWVDLNGDGNPDAALIDGDNRLRVFLNQRSGKFRRPPCRGASKRFTRLPQAILGQQPA